MWYIEMLHVRTFFSVWRHGFFALRDVHSQRACSSSRRKLTVVFVYHRTVSMIAVYQLKIKYDQDKFVEAAWPSG